jgi:hypothetical protein
MALNDATLLRMLKSSGRAGGGQFVRVRGQEFYAIFDNGFSQALDLVESSEPYLTMRTSDVTRVKLVKDDVIDGLAQVFRVKHHEPDGTGMSRILLKS